MSTRRICAICVFTLIALVQAACSLPSTSTSQPPPPANGTAAMQTALAQVAATLTLAALQGGGAGPVQPPPPQQPAATPTFTLTPSLTPTITLTPTPEGAWISVSTETKCRLGPGKAYDQVGGLIADKSVQVFGRDPSGQYYYIRNPNDPTSFCWVWAYYATPVGNFAVVPVFTPPATPTPVASFTFVYKTWGVGPGYQCMMVEVNNTGGLTWESFNLAFHDVTHGYAATSSSDFFTSYDGWCGATGSQSDLMPGEIGIASVKTFMGYNPHGDTMEFTLTLCSQNGLAGSCLTKTITIIF